jgi:hypothetical protein
MVANKIMMSVTQRSFLTVASLTLCLTTERVVAREFPSPLGHFPPVREPLLDANFHPQTPLAVRFPVDSQTQLFSPVGSGSIDRVDPSASLPDSQRVPSSESISAPNRALAQQLDVGHNHDLANLTSFAKLSTAIDSAATVIVAPHRHQRSLPKQPTPPAPLVAQATSPAEIDDLVRQVRTSLTPTSQTRRVAPAISFVNPIGFGGYFGNVGLGVAYQSSTALGNKDDGNFGATVSLGDPRKFVGVDMTVVVNSISNDRNRGGGGTLGSNTLSLQLSRELADDLSIGIGAENLLAFNPSERNISTTLSYYFVATKVFPLNRDRSKPFSTLYTSLGLGNGRFLPAGKVTVRGEPGVNVFGSAAIQVIDGVNGIVEWTGQDVNLAVSIVPFRNIPLAITPAMVDLIGTSQNRGARFNISAGYSFQF